MRQLAVAVLLLACSRRAAAEPGRKAEDVDVWRPWTSTSGWTFGQTIGGAISDWELGAGSEMVAWSHNVSTPAGKVHGAYLHHFWSAGGKGSIGMYAADRQIIRYYVDGEQHPSIEFEPAMACGSGIGWEGLPYYQAGLNEKEPWGPTMSNSMIGHSARVGGGWHNRFKIPFSQSIRVTVQLPGGIPANFTSKMFLIFRGIEGDPRPLHVGELSLPPTVPWTLRLRKFQTRLNHVRPLEIVSFANWTSANNGPDSGGALLFSVFVINPFGGALEGCFRAYTERSGPLSRWPGLMLSTGTEDYYDSAYYFDHEEQTFYEEDAGFSHKSLSSTAAGADDFDRSRAHRTASMFRLHHNDPLYFRGKFNLIWRDGATMVSKEGHKCVARNSNVSIGGGVVDLTVDSWLYTWEQPLAGETGKEGKPSPANSQLPYRNHQPPPIKSDDALSTAYLVESLPTAAKADAHEYILPAIQGTGRTTDVQISLLDSAQSKVDVTVMYWNLIAKRQDHYNVTALGGDDGKRLYDAFERAVARGIDLRILQCRGPSLCDDTEALKLQSRFPAKVQIRYWNASSWYGGGIMHQKVWVADNGDRVYIGSANMDWLSLTQVKELGVVVNFEKQVGGDAADLFNRWWVWTGLPEPTSDGSTFVPAVSQNLTLPCWSAALPVSARCANPLPDADLVANISHPYHVKLNKTKGSAFIGASPPEILNDGGAAAYRELVHTTPTIGLGSRTWDQDGLIHTIRSCSIGGTVSLSVMDYLPSSAYSPPAAAVWWPALNDALLAAALSRGARVRVLISKWAHTSDRIVPSLIALNNSAAAVCSHGPAYLPKCGPSGTGSLEIRLFEVPGWDSTIGNAASYPPYSRVNHAKYIVSDKRVNIGTSNMEWGYFWNTAGASFNTDHNGLVEQAQAIFDRDWESQLAKPLEFN